MSRTHIIRIDALGQNNFQLQRVGDPRPAVSFRVYAGDDIRFVAYRGNRRIDYEIFFKDQRRSPFTDVDRIAMPDGGVSEALTVTTLLKGGMPFAIRIPSLGWQVDPEILVDGAPLVTDLDALVEKLKLMQEVQAISASHDYTPNPIHVDVSSHAVTFTPPTTPLNVHPGDTISWDLDQDGVGAPQFSINFSSTSGLQSPLEDLENGIHPDYYDGTTAFVASRIFRSLQGGEGASKNFTYLISMQTGTGTQLQPQTIHLS